MTLLEADRREAKVVIFISRMLRDMNKMATSYG